MAETTRQRPAEAPSTEESPFRAAPITEGYPFDDRDKAEIKRILEDVRQRQRPENGRSAQGGA